MNSNHQGGLDLGASARMRGLQVPKVSQLVADDLRARIAHGEIRDGDLLPPEPELIEQYQVSRPTLREAIRILETEGLVTTTRGGRKGARVHHPDSSQAARQVGLMLQLRGSTLPDILDQLAALAIAGARAAAERTPAPDLAGVERIVAKLGAVEEEPRLSAQLLRHFDSAVCALAGNQTTRLLADMMAEIADLHIENLPNRVLDSMGVTADRTMLDRMAAIIAAIGAGEPDRAETLMREHVALLAQTRAAQDVGPQPLRLIA